MDLTPHWQLRARFAKALSDLYGTEVPAYTTLVEVSQEVNRDFVAANPDTADRFGSINRVTAERHGAIRVGSPTELAQVARVFGAIGMQPVGFYDLRDAKPNPIPVVSTAFRPVDRAELARNPFRVFTSLLVPEDRRFFTPELEQQLKDFIAARTLFPEELLEIADRSIADGGLAGADADRFIELATASFALSPEPVDRAWYEKLDAISSVAADIGGVNSTHINHLTPRVLDIDDLYRRMSDRGIQMIDAIQGPPRWDGPDLLLRQTSFRALAEPRAFREADGTVGSGDLRVRFGEVEARGIALTQSGRDHYDTMVGEVDSRQAATGRPRPEVAREVWGELCAPTERELLERDHGFFNFTAVKTGSSGAPADLLALIDGGWLVAEPIVYEDFLPRSAAGIFASNLSGDGSVDESQDIAARDLPWMAEKIGVAVNDPYALYTSERQASFEAAVSALGLSAPSVTTPWSGR
ncbi:VOC family protein [Microbacterium sp.]|uniref:2-oxoadipate dioxygenase/decarboxylase n=1 Tax=Microbacterium sp. TaxID=51671 RepID=UPI0028AB91CB|nr:VOC family protein [Microbacterium sp.]